MAFDNTDRDGPWRFTLAEARPASDTRSRALGLRPAARPGPYDLRDRPRPERGFYRSSPETRRAASRWSPSPLPADTSVAPPRCRRAWPARAWRPWRRGRGLSAGWRGRGARQTLTLTPQGRPLGLGPARR
ncbi:hypothetical protein ACRAWD_32135 [Caulobacter segnis]